VIRGGDKKPHRYGDSDSRTRYRGKSEKGAKRAKTQQAHTAGKSIIARPNSTPFILNRGATTQHDNSYLNLADQQRLAQANRQRLLAFTLVMMGGILMARMLVIFHYRPKWHHQDSFLRNIYIYCFLQGLIYIVIGSLMLRAAFNNDKVYSDKLQFSTYKKSHLGAILTLDGDLLGVRKSSHGDGVDKKEKGDISGSSEKRDSDALKNSSKVSLSNASADGSRDLTQRISEPTSSRQSPIVAKISESLDKVKGRVRNCFSKFNERMFGSLFDDIDDNTARKKTTIVRRRVVGVSNAVPQNGETLDLQMKHTNTSPAKDSTSLLLLQATLSPSKIQNQISTRLSQSVIYRHTKRLSKDEMLRLIIFASIIFWVLFLQLLVYREIIFQQNSFNDPFRDLDASLKATKLEATVRKKLYESLVGKTVGGNNGGSENILNGGRNNNGRQQQCTRSYSECADDPRFMLQTALAKFKRETVYELQKVMKSTMKSTGGGADREDTTDGAAQPDALSALDIRATLRSKVQQLLNSLEEAVSVHLETEYLRAVEESLKEEIYKNRFGNMGKVENDISVEKRRLVQERSQLKKLDEGIREFLLSSDDGDAAGESGTASANNIESDNSRRRMSTGTETNIKITSANINRYTNELRERTKKLGQDFEKLSRRLKVYKETSANSKKFFQLLGESFKARYNENSCSNAELEHLGQSMNKPTNRAAVPLTVEQIEQLNNANIGMNSASNPLDSMSPPLTHETDLAKLRDRTLASTAADNFLSDVFGFTTCASTSSFLPGLSNLINLQNHRCFQGTYADRKYSQQKQWKNLPNWWLNLKEFFDTYLPLLGRAWRSFVRYILKPVWDFFLVVFGFRDQSAYYAQNRHSNDRFESVDGSSSNIQQLIPFSRRVFHYLQRTLAIAAKHAAFFHNCVLERRLFQETVLPEDRENVFCDFGAFDGVYMKREFLYIFGLSSSQTTSSLSDDAFSSLSQNSNGGFDSREGDDIISDDIDNDGVFEDSDSNSNSSTLRRDVSERCDVSNFWTVEKGINYRTLVEEAPKAYVVGAGKDEDAAAEEYEFIAHHDPVYTTRRVVSVRHIRLSTDAGNNSNGDVEDVQQNSDSDIGGQAGTSGNSDSSSNGSDAADDGSEDEEDEGDEDDDDDDSTLENSSSSHGANGVLRGNQYELEVNTDAYGDYLETLLHLRLNDIGETSGASSSTNIETSATSVSSSTTAVAADPSASTATDATTNANPNSISNNPDEPEMNAQEKKALTQTLNQLFLQMSDELGQLYEYGGSAFAEGSVFGIQGRSYWDYFFGVNIPKSGNYDQTLSTNRNIHHVGFHYEYNYYDKRLVYGVVGDLLREFGKALVVESGTSTVQSVSTTTPSDITETITTTTTANDDAVSTDESSSTSSSSTTTSTSTQTPTEAAKKKPSNADTTAHTSSLQDDAHNSPGMHKRAQEAHLREIKSSLLRYYTDRCLEHFEGLYSDELPGGFDAEYSETEITSTTSSTGAQSLHSSSVSSFNVNSVGSSDGGTVDSSPVLHDEIDSGAGSIVTVTQSPEATESTGTDDEEDDELLKVTQRIEERSKSSVLGDWFGNAIGSYFDGGYFDGSFYTASMNSNNIKKNQHVLSYYPDLLLVNQSGLVRAEDLQAYLAYPIIQVDPDRVTNQFMDAGTLDEMFGGSGGSGGSDSNSGESDSNSGQKTTSSSTTTSTTSTAISPSSSTGSDSQVATNTVVEQQQQQQQHPPPPPQQQQQQLLAESSNDYSTSHAQCECEHDIFRPIGYFDELKPTLDDYAREHVFYVCCADNYVLKKFLKRLTKAYGGSDVGKSMAGKRQVGNSGSPNVNRTPQQHGGSVTTGNPATTGPSSSSSTSSTASPGSTTSPSSTTTTTVVSSSTHAPGPSTPSQEGLLPPMQQNTFSQKAPWQTQTSFCCIFLDEETYLPEVFSGYEVCLKQATKFLHKPEKMKKIRAYGEMFENFVKDVQVVYVYPNLRFWPGGIKFHPYGGLVLQIDSGKNVEVQWRLAGGYEAKRILNVGERVVVEPSLLSVSRAIGNSNSGSSMMDQGLGDFHGARHGHALSGQNLNGNYIANTNTQFRSHRSVLSYVDSLKKNRFELIFHKADGYYLNSRKCEVGRSNSNAQNAQSHVNGSKILPGLPEYANRIVTLKKKINVYERKRQKLETEIGDLLSVSGELNRGGGGGGGGITSVDSVGEDSEGGGVTGATGAQTPQTTIAGTSSSTASASGSPTAAENDNSSGEPAVATEVVDAVDTVDGVDAGSDTTTSTTTSENDHNGPLSIEAQEQIEELKTDLQKVIDDINALNKKLFQLQNWQVSYLKENKDSFIGRIINQNEEVMKECYQLKGSDESSGGSIQSSGNLLDQFEISYQVCQLYDDHVDQVNIYDKVISTSYLNRNSNSRPTTTVVHDSSSGGGAYSTGSNILGGGGGGGYSKRSPDQRKQNLFSTATNLRRRTCDFLRRNRADFETCSNVFGAIPPYSFLLWCPAKGKWRHYISTEDSHLYDQTEFGIPVEKLKFAEMITVDSNVVYENAGGNSENAGNSGESDQGPQAQSGAASQTTDQTGSATETTIATSTSTSTTTTTSSSSASKKPTSPTPILSPLKYYGANADLVRNYHGNEPGQKWKYGLVYETEGSEKDLMMKVYGGGDGVNSEKSSGSTSADGSASVQNTSAGQGGRSSQQSPSSAALASTQQHQQTSSSSSPQSQQTSSQTADQNQIHYTSTSKQLRKNKKKKGLKHSTKGMKKYYPPQQGIWKQAQPWTYPFPGTVGVYLDSFQQHEDLVVFCHTWPVFRFYLQTHLESLKELSLLGIILVAGWCFLFWITKKWFYRVEGFDHGHENTRRRSNVKGKSYYFIVFYQRSLERLRNVFEMGRKVLARISSWYGGGNLQKNRNFYTKEKFRDQSRELRNKVKRDPSRKHHYESRERSERYRRHASKPAQEIEMQRLGG